MTHFVVVIVIHHASSIGNSTASANTSSVLYRWRQKCVYSLKKSRFCQLKYFATVGLSFEMK